MPFSSVQLDFEAPRDRLTWTKPQCSAACSRSGLETDETDTKIHDNTKQRYADLSAPWPGAHRYASGQLRLVSLEPKLELTGYFLDWLLDGCGVKTGYS